LSANNFHKTLQTSVCFYIKVIHVVGKGLNRASKQKDPLKGMAWNSV